MKIALFGGSFDPPHAGHDAAVKAILSALKPDLLVIMPSFLNPFKKNFSAPPQLRLRWCRALWSDTPRIKVSDYEISQNRSVPTIQSVKFLLEKYGGNGKIAAEAAARDLCFFSPSRKPGITASISSISGWVEYTPETTGATKLSSTFLPIRARTSSPRVFAFAPTEAGSTLSMRARRRPLLPSTPAKDLSERSPGMPIIPVLGVFRAP